MPRRRPPSLQLPPRKTTTSTQTSQKEQTEAERPGAAVEAYKEEHGIQPLGKKTEISQLPRWVKVALTQYETEDITLKEAATRHGFTVSALSKYASSPAGKQWREAVREIADDPMKLTEMVMRSTVMGVALDNLIAMQNALDAGDYKEYGIMARDWLDRNGVTKKPAGDGSGAQVLIVRMGNDASLEAEAVETSYQAMPGEDGLIVDAELLEDPSN